MFTDSAGAHCVSVLYQALGQHSSDQGKIAGAGCRVWWSGGGGKMRGRWVGLAPEALHQGAWEALLRREALGLPANHLPL